MMRVFFRAFTAAALLAVPLAGNAQSNLSSQGFGFPTGQFSSRSNGTAGATAEMDPLSPVNPASVSLIGSRLIFFQIEPEFRTVTTPTGGTERTTTARYPVVMGALPFRPNLIFSLAASTLLDRTSTTSFTTAQHLNAVDSVISTTQYHIDGAMADLRLGAAWIPNRWLRLGVGAHAITGHNLVRVTQTFDDSTRFSPFSESRVLGFSGAAGSVGAQVIGKNFVAAASVRAGGDLTVSSVDTTIGKGKVPTRFGGSLAYTGLANSVFAVRTAHEGWSSLGGLGTPGLNGVDAWDTSVGADVAGPKFGDQIIFLRGGLRNRTLPFQASGKTVTEKSFTAGLGTAFANGRVLTDFAVMHAARDANLAASERAWTVSLGFSVRP
jgi:hypothetical protein